MERAKQSDINYLKALHLKKKNNYILKYFCFGWNSK